MEVNDDLDDTPTLIDMAIQSVIVFSPMKTRPSNNVTTEMLEYKNKIK